MRRDRTGWLIAAAVAVALFAMSWARHANYWSGGLDLGVFDQGVWLMSRGFAPEVTVNGRNLFADHLSGVLFLFVPLYRLIATPAWLLGAQAVALGSTVVPMRALARHEHASPALATAMTALSAPLISAAMFDFHPSSLAVPFVALAVLAARRGDTKMAALSAIAVVFCRADLAWVLVGVAVVATPAVRRRLLAIAPFALVAAVVIPSALGARGTFDVHYGYLGTSAVNVALHPWRVVIHGIFRVDALQTAIISLLPVAFLPLFRWRWTLALALAAAPVLLSQWPGVSLPWFHYAAPFAPIAIGGALVVTAEPIRWRLAVRPAALVGVFVAVALVAQSPLSPRAPDSLRLSEIVHREPGIDYAAAVAAVRPGEAVVADNRALAHLTHRHRAWLFPSPFAPFDPPALGPDVSPAAGRRITVAVVRAKDLAAAEHDGFTDAHRVGGLFVARRS